MRPSHSSGFSRTSASHREAASTLWDSTGVGRTHWGKGCRRSRRALGAICARSRSRGSPSALTELQARRRRRTRAGIGQAGRQGPHRRMGGRGSPPPLSCPSDAFAELLHAPSQQRARARAVSKLFCPNPRRHPEVRWAREGSRQHSRLGATLTAPTSRVTLLP